MTWVAEHTADISTLYLVCDDGRPAYERRKGKTCKRDGTTHSADDPGGP